MEMIDYANKPLAWKVGQLVMASLDGDAPDARALAFLRAHSVGNVIHFGNNVSTRGQATALNARLRDAIVNITGVPPLIGIDHEGGRVMRFREGVTGFPCAMAIAAGGSVDTARAIGAAMGAELRAMGFHIQFAPVLDVNTNPANPVIGARAFGDDPARVAAFGAAMARGIQSAGVLACGKHFPGHGDTAEDSHFDLPRVARPLDALLSSELRPFQAAMDAGIRAVMTSHILYPAIEPGVLPATMSPAILGGLLRGGMGFDGLIVSDAMHMRAIVDHFGLKAGCVAAVRAGVDLLCIGTGGGGHLDTQAACCGALLRAARDGSLPLAHIDGALARVMAAKAWAMGAPEGAPVDWRANQALADKSAQASITCLRGPLPTLRGGVLCVSRPSPSLSAGLVEGDWRTLSFAEQAAPLLGARACVLDGAPPMAAIEAADAVVLGVGGGTSTELACLDAILRAKKRAIVVLTGAPYALASLPPSVPTLCLYALTPASVRAVCGVLRGGQAATGALPVRLPSAPG